MMQVRRRQLEREKWGVTGAEPTWKMNTASDPQERVRKSYEEENSL